jgi:molybdopterin converting factor subunit 1
MVNVLYFAACKERTGRDEESLLLDGLTVDEALARLIELHPRLAEIRSHLRVAVNQRFAGGGTRIPSGAELALIPPVAGGSSSPRVQVIDVPIVTDDVIDRVRAPEAGAIVTMIGTVRDHNEGEGVRGLRYEAYVGMAERVIEEIVDEVLRDAKGARAAVVHRIGELAIGDAAVVVAVSTPHRQDAFALCQHIIDRLKKDAPIWKHETRASGKVWVGLGP